MAFQSVPETAEIVVKYQGNSVECVNVFHARRVGGYSLPQIQALAASVDLSVAANWLPIQVIDWLYLNTTVRGLEDENDFESINNTSSALGAVLGPGLPGNATISIKKLSGLTGRSARGRLYWIALAVSHLASNENLVDTLHVAAIEVAITAMQATLSSAGWVPVIVSRFTDNAKRPVGVTFTWDDTEAVNENVDSQRGRLLN